MLLSQLGNLGLLGVIKVADVVSCRGLLIVALLTT